MERTLQESVQTLTACVDDAGVAQDGQERRRLGHRLMCPVHRRGEHILEIPARIGGADGCCRRLPNDCQDGAFDWFGHGLVRRGGSLRQRVRQVGPAEAMLATESVGHAAEDLGGNDARVAARPHQCPKADGLSYPISRRIVNGFSLGQRRLNCGQHVAAGVAVRDRKDIERIDLFDMGRKVFGRRTEGGQKPRPVAGSARHRLARVVI